MKGWARLLAAVSMAAITASCTCGGGTERPSESDGGAPRRGGILVMADIEVASSFDPLGTLDINASIFPVLHVYDQLVRADREGKSVEPDLAESWDVSPDGRVYTFHLRPGLKFSDGSKLSASDVKFSLERRAREDTGLSQTLFPPLEVEAKDDRTVVLTLKAPWAPLLSDLALYSSSIVPEAYMSRVGKEGFAKAPIGSGPFLLAEWKKNEGYVLKRNPNHWDARYPYLDEVRHIAIPDDNTRALKVQAGEVDVAEFIPFNQIEALRRAPNVAVLVEPIMGLDSISLNLRVPPLKDVKARQAMSWAIDREAIIRAVNFGHGEVPRSFLPRVAYTDMTQPPFGHDLEKAKKLLSESASPGGFSVKLLIMALDGARQVGALVQSQLEAANIHVEVQQVENALFWERFLGGTFEMALSGSTSDIPDPSEMVYFSALSTSPNPKAMGYANPEVDRLAAKAQTEMDPARRAELYREVQRLVREDAPYLWLSWSPARSATRSNVHGFTVLPTGNYRLWEVWKSR